MAAGVLYMDWVAPSNSNVICKPSKRRRRKKRSPLQQIHYNIEAPAVEAKVQQVIKGHYEAYLRHLNYYRNQGLSLETLRNPMTQFLIWFTAPGVHRGLQMSAHFNSRFDGLFLIR